MCSVAEWRADLDLQLFLVSGINLNQVQPKVAG